MTAPDFHYLAFALTGSDARILADLTEATGKDERAVMAAGLRLLGIVHALHNLHGIVAPVPDPREAGA